MIRVGDHPNDAQPTNISKIPNTQTSTNLQLAIVVLATNKIVELELFW